MHLNLFFLIISLSLNYVPLIMTKGFFPFQPNPNYLKNDGTWFEMHFLFNLTLHRVIQIKNTIFNLSKNI